MAMMKVLMGDIREVVGINDGDVAGDNYDNSGEDDIDASDDNLIESELSVCQVATSTKFDTWQYLMLTWKEDEGLTLYANGELLAKSNDPIPEEGKHARDSFTRLAVGRSSSGPPYGNTKMSVGSLVFFETHLPKSDALKMFLYYWGNGKISMTNSCIEQSLL